MIKQFKECCNKYCDICKDSPNDLVPYYTNKEFYSFKSEDREKIAIRLGLIDNIKRKNNAKS